MSDGEQTIEQIRRFFGQRAPDPTDPARVTVGSAALAYARAQGVESGGEIHLSGLPVYLDESLPATEWRVYSREGGIDGRGWVPDGPVPVTEAPAVVS